MEVINLGSSRRFLREQPIRVKIFDRPRVVCDLICLEPGQRELRRQLSTSDEFYLVIEGKARLHAGSQVQDLETLDAVLVPPGVEHALENPGPGQLSVLVMVAPKPARAGEVHMPAAERMPRSGDKRPFLARSGREDGPARGEGEMPTRPAQEPAAERPFVERPPFRERRPAFQPYRASSTRARPPFQSSRPPSSDRGRPSADSRPRPEAAGADRGERPAEGRRPFNARPPLRDGRPLQPSRPPYGDRRPHSGDRPAPGPERGRASEGPPRGGFSARRPGPPPAWAGRNDRQPRGEEGGPRRRRPGEVFGTARRGPDQGPFTSRPRPEGSEVGPGRRSFTPRGRGHFTGPPAAGAGRERPQAARSVPGGPRGRAGVGGPRSGPRGASRPASGQRVRPGSGQSGPRISARRSAPSP